MASNADIFDTTAALIEIKEKEFSWSARVEAAKKEAESIIAEARSKVKETETKMVSEALEEAKRRLHEEVIKAEEEADAMLREAETACITDNKLAKKNSARVVAEIISRVANA